MIPLLGGSLLLDMHAFGSINGLLIGFLLPKRGYSAAQEHISGNHYHLEESFAQCPPRRGGATCSFFGQWKYELVDVVTRLRCKGLISGVVVV